MDTMTDQAVYNLSKVKRKTILAAGEERKHVPVRVLRCMGCGVILLEGRL